MEQNMGLPLMLLLPLLVHSSLASSCSSAADLRSDSEATMVALLTLHTGANCSRVSLQGLQQLAALETAVEHVNAEDSSAGLKLGIRAFDTCGDPQEAVKASLRALVSIERTCLRPPLFLGFVGPSDVSSLAAVQRVTRVFELPHVLPSGEDSLALSVTSPRNYHKLQSILLLLRRLQARGLVVVRSSDSSSSLLADELMGAAKSAGLCVVRPVLDANRLPSLTDVAAGTSVVLVVGDATTAADLLPQIPAQLAVLVVATSVGVLGPLSYSRLRLSGSSQLLVLHEVAEPGIVPAEDWAQRLKASPLWTDYVLQQHTDAREEVTDAGDEAYDALELDRTALQYSQVQDASLAPLTYAVSLFAAAARASQRARCRGADAGVCAELLALSQREWRGTLGAVTAFARTSAVPTRRLRFHMDVPSLWEIYAWSSEKAALHKVGELTGGKNLNVTDEDALSWPESSAPSLCYGAQPTSTPPLPATEPNAVPAAPAAAAPRTTQLPPKAAGPVSDDPLATWLGLQDYGEYQLMGLLGGVGVGLIAFLVLVVYVVYSSFRVRGRSERNSDGSSRSSKRTRDSRDSR